MYRDSYTIRRTQVGRGIVGALGLTAIAAMVLGCSVAATPATVTQDAQAEDDRETVAVSQIAPPRAGTSDGSAVVYIPPLGESVVIAEVADGGRAEELCRLDASGSVSGLIDRQCHWLQWSDIGGAHVRVDGLDSGVHTLEISMRDAGAPASVQRVTFEVPGLSLARVTASPAPESMTGAPYDARVVSVAVGSSSGTVTMRMHLPVLAPGATVAVSVLDGPRSRELCEVVVGIEDTGAVSDGSCDVEPRARDLGRGRLDGVVLVAHDLPPDEFYEVDVRGLRQLEDGSWTGTRGTRAVHRIGGLFVTEGEQ